MPYNANTVVHTELRLWDLESGAELMQLHGHTGRLSGLAFLPGNQQAVSAADDGTVRLWDLNAASQIAEFDAGLPITSMQRSRRMGDCCSRGHSDLPRQYAPIADPSTPTLRLWDLQAGGDLNRFDTFTRGVSQVAFAPGGKNFAAAIDPGPHQILIWGIGDTQPLTIAVAASSFISSLIFSPDGLRVVGGFRDGACRVGMPRPAASAFTMERRTRRSLCDGVLAGWQDPRFSRWESSYRARPAFPRIGRIVCSMYATRIPDRNW